MSREGRIVTFYSYKGGTGRTMALSNIGVLLAKWGYRVLLVDWDIEAPGLQFFFRPFLPNNQSMSYSDGIIELLRKHRTHELLSNRTLRWKDILFELRVPDAKTLHLIAPHHRDEGYFHRVTDLNIEGFYAHDGGFLIESLREEWKAEYDFTLVDSRTGVTDIGGICTIQLPDYLVLLFTPTDQALEGTLQISPKVRAAQEQLPVDRQRLLVIPVLSRLDVQQEFVLLQEWMSKCAKRLQSIYQEWLPTSVVPERMLEATKLPYRPFFSFGEKLAVIEEGVSDPTSLGFAYENLAALIANRLESTRSLLEDRDFFVRRAAGNGRRRLEKRVRVFISYSHKDEAWKDMLVTHLRSFVHQGDVVLWDDRKIGTGTDWYPKIREEIEKVDITICLISADYLASGFINKEEIPDMKRRRKDEGMLILPLLLSPCSWKAVKWLSGIQMFPRGGLSLEEIESKVRRKKVMADFAEEVHKRITAEDFAIPVAVSAFSPPEKVDITRLPETGAQLFGREKELQLLDEMWDSGSANVVSLVAWGGVGKSTLVNQWLKYLKSDNYRGAKRVYGWSFYSQGTGQRVTSADQFMSEALTWFGDTDPTQGSPWDKGERLAEIIRREKTLLILDGLEPLQSGLDFEKGKINDPALSVLVTQLARQNNGLCVITTREKVADLEHHPETALQVDLEQISKEAGRALLRVSGVQGTDEELETTSEAFGNHTLAVRLIAAFLYGIEGHCISNAASIPDLDIPNEEGRHSRRVIEAFEKRFGESPQRQVLYIMGLFDRPAYLGEIEAVKAPPAIPGLTDKLVSLTEGQWYDLLDELRGCGLLAPKSTHIPSILDCQPLIREHLAEKLRIEQHETWQAAHQRLYEYLIQTTEYRPDTSEGLQPLYQAVAHGCQAGMHQDVLYKVYIDRILRGMDGPDAYYSINKLGAIGSDLAGVACFFERFWATVARQLSGADQAWLLNEAATRLRALGRLTEAVEPMRAGLQMGIQQENWKQAGIRAGNLSELELTLGQVAMAVQNAEWSVDYADRSEDVFWRMGERTTLADALFQAGQKDKAADLFRQAQAIQGEGLPKHSLLYSLEDFRYCDLLLARAECATWQTLLRPKTPDSEVKTAIDACRAVEQRTTQGVKCAKQFGILLDIALNYLSLGRADLYEAILEDSGPKTLGSKLAQAASCLSDAVDGLRRAGTMDFLPHGLLSRALLRFVEKDIDGCRADLDEAWQIAERGSMRLHMADVWLHRGRLFRDKEALTEAEKLINECGYHRRDEELADAWEAAKNW